MKQALASAQIHFEDYDLSVNVHQFNHDGKMVAVSFGQTLSSVDIFMTSEQFGELMAKLQVVNDEMMEAAAPGEAV